VTLQQGFIPRNTRFAQWHERCGAPLGKNRYNNNGFTRKSLATGGNKLIDVLAEKRPDVLILDYLLPDGRGLDAVRGYAEIANRPPVLVTSHADECIVAEAAQAGITDLVPKSIAGFERLPALAQKALGAVSEGQPD
jgi:DNA-binding NarL/FixJ family response regulator